MRLFRSSSATLLAASLLALGACGGENAPTAPDPTPPATGLGTRDITLSRTHMSFSYNTITRSLNPVAPGEDEVLVGGLIALASIANVGQISYPTASNAWLTFERSVDIPSRSWRLRFRPEGLLLPAGVHTALVPIIVPGALNNPQILTVTMVACDLTNCLSAGSDVLGSLSNTDPTWSRGSNLNAPGGYNYDDYRLFVLPGQTLQVHMIGSPCSNPDQTLSDPYTYIFYQGAEVDSDDDSGCGYNSISYVTNGSAVAREYLLRATNYSTGQLGTYRIIVTDWSSVSGVRSEQPVDETSPEYLEYKRANADK